MTPVHVTTHAALRYVERVDGRLTVEEAFAAILSHSRAIQVAADFRCDTVVLGEGGKLKLDGTRVITVLPRSARSRLTEALS